MNAQRNTPVTRSLDAAAAAAASLHWCQRVRERIGPDVCPWMLSAALFIAIDRGDAARVEFLGRVRRDGVRAFRFRLACGRVFVALLQTDRRVAVTVLGRGQHLCLARGDRIACGDEPVARNHLQPLVAGYRLRGQSS